MTTNVSLLACYIQHFARLLDMIFKARFGNSYHRYVRKWFI